MTAAVDCHCLLQLAIRKGRGSPQGPCGPLAWGLSVIFYLFSVTLFASDVIPSMGVSRAQPFACIDKSDPH